VKKRLFLISTIIIILVALIIFIVFSKNKTGPSLVIKQINIGTVSGLVNEAKDLQAKGNLLEAKSIYQRLINEYPNSGEVMNWQKKGEDLNIKLLFSSIITPGSILYDIRPGDTLTKIAKEFKTTPELIRKSNYLSDDKIFPDKKIKVCTATFSIVVDKSQNTLILKTGEEIIKTYIVSTGVNNSTPLGNFKIINKLASPTWYKAGVVVSAGSPGNILGSRWLGFDLAGYGIHGTTDPQSLGRQVTQGCVRMSNSDVEELYSIVPVETEVTIVD
jgi:lipoprotein-anchoring transpeptidase ErfK/SrfK